jgi:hypothetical protein
VNPDIDVAPRLNDPRVSELMQLICNRTTTRQWLTQGREHPRSISRLESTMYRIACRAGGIASIAAALLMITPQPASATFPAPDGGSNSVQVVRVLVPTPVDDTSAEAVQIILSVVFGAAVATIANRRTRGRPNRAGGSERAVAWVDPPPVERSTVITTDVLSG